MNAQTSARNLRLLLIACLAMVLSACESTPVKREPKATGEEITAADQEALACAGRAAAQMDDGISPANVIGHQVGVTCSEQIWKTVALRLRGEDPYAINFAWDRRNKDADDYGTTVVLKVRSQRRTDSRDAAGR